MTDGETYLVAQHPVSGGLVFIDQRHVPGLRAEVGPECFDALTRLDLDLDPDRPLDETENPYRSVSRVDPLAWSA